MKKKIFGTLLAILLVCTAISPAFATEAPKIMFNGANLSSAVAPINVEGRVLVPARFVSEALGADVVWDPVSQTATITKGSDVIKIKANSSSVEKNGQPVSIPAPAIIRDGSIMLPIRFFAENFGAQVDWDSASSAVVINYNETRDGMTPGQYLANCSAEMAKYSTYKFNGTLNVKVAGIENNKPQSAEAKMEMNGAFKAPTEMYYKVGMTLPPEAGAAAGTPVAMEFYTNGTKFYQKLPDSDWKDLGVSLPENLINNNSSMNQSPEQILRQIQDFGIVTSFGNDVTKGGKQYTVINAKIDQEKYFAALGNLMQQVTENSANPDASNAEQAKEQIAQMLKGMKMDYTCHFLINKATKVMETMKIDATMKMNIDQVQVTTHTSGDINMYDFGEPVQMPQIGNGK